MGKKKLSKAEKKKLENEQAEALRIEMEKIRYSEMTRSSVINVL